MEELWKQHLQNHSITLLYSLVLFEICLTYWSAFPTVSAYQKYVFIPNSLPSSWNTKIQIISSGIKQEELEAASSCLRWGCFHTQENCSSVKEISSQGRNQGWKFSFSPFEQGWITWVYLQTAQLFLPFSFFFLYYNHITTIETKLQKQ